VSARDDAPAEFEPARLGPPRRRLDPITVGALVVVAAIGLAVLKPWGSPAAEIAQTSARPRATTAVDAAPTAIPIVRPRAVDLVDTPPITWAAAEAAIQPHEAWGIRAIVRSDAPEGALVERWAEAVRTAPGEVGSSRIGDPSLDDPNRWLASPPTPDQGVLALGLTFPAAERPAAVRILAATETGWTWLDTVALDPAGRRTPGTVTFGPPRIDGVRPATWPKGSYRLDVLTGGSIRHVDVGLPNRFENVPGPAAGVDPAAASDLPSPFAPDLASVRDRGLFVVEDGEAVGVPALVGPPLNAAAAWSAASAVGTSEPPPVAAITAPTANGLGFVFATDAFDPSVSVTRILPISAVAGSRRVAAVLFEGDDRVPYVIVEAPDDRPWPAGLYRLDLSWRDADGPHVAAVHLDLLPGRSPTTAAATPTASP